MVPTCSHPPKGFLIRWKSIGGKCRDGSPTPSGPLPCRFSLQNRACQHSQSFSRTKDGWLLLGSSPPRHLSTPHRPASAGPFRLYSRPGRRTLIRPCARASIITSCHSTGRLRSTPPSAYLPPGGCTSESYSSSPRGPLFCPVDQLFPTPRPSVTP